VQINDLFLTKSVPVHILFLFCNVKKKTSQILLIYNLHPNSFQGCPLSRPHYTVTVYSIRIRYQINKAKINLYTFIVQHMWLLDEVPKNDMLTQYINTVNKFSCHHSQKIRDPRSYMVNICTGTLLVRKRSFICTCFRTS
jgi:hypothetical protein